MKNVKFIVILFLGVCFSSQAQVQKDNQQPYIEVNAKATKSVVPDRIYISICLEDRILRKKTISVSEQEESLKKMIDKLGLDLSDLALDNRLSDYVRVKWRKDDVINKSEYTLLVTNASMVGKVFKELDRIEIKGAYISKLDHSEILRFQKETRIEAMKANKEKADYLLEAIEEKTGKPLEIRETTHVQNATTPMVSVYSNRADGYNSINSSNGSSEELQFEKIKIICTIYGKFKIQ